MAMLEKLRRMARSPIGKAIRSSVELYFAVLGYAVIVMSLFMPHMLDAGAVLHLAWVYFKVHFFASLYVYVFKYYVSNHRGNKS